MTCFNIELPTFRRKQKLQMHTGLVNEHTVHEAKALTSTCLKFLLQWKSGIITDNTHTFIKFICTENISEPYKRLNL